ncbi:MAG: glycosyltransferase, partial [bacterium]
MISIVIVGYNSRQDLKDCFDSLFTSSYKRFKIIYVDNGSSDGSYQFVKDNYSKVIAIKNKNTGYAGGNNVGIKYALKHNMSKYPYRSSLPARRSFNEVGSRTNFSIPRLSAVHSKNKTDKANTRAESHYVFILNPDTIVD